MTMTPKERTPFSHNQNQDPMSGADASNVCLPQSHPVISIVPGLPKSELGERCGIFSVQGRSVAPDAFLYASRNQVIVRSTTPNDALVKDAIRQSAFCYRGHAFKATVSAVRANPAGSYVASADSTGQLKIWALDNEDHRCKYEQRVLSDIIRDVDWDGEGKRICLTGERARIDNSACSKALQWDTGTTIGVLAIHEKGRANACSMKPNRPFRLVTAGNDDSRLLFHKGGPPFQAESSPDERAHDRGKAVHSVRFSPDGNYIASVSADRSVCIYTGKEMKLITRHTAAHNATIYDVAWHSDSTSLLTASGDGTCKLWKLESESLSEVQCYKVAEHQNGGNSFTKVPPGAAQIGCDFLNPETPISVSLNGQLSILNKDSSIETITGHSAPIADSCLDETQFYTCDSDGVLVAWDRQTCQPVERLSNDPDLFHKVHKGAATAVAAVQGSLFSVGYDDQLRVTKDGKVQESSTPLGAQPVAMASGSTVACIVTVQSLILVDASGAILDQATLSYEGLCVAVTKNDAKVFVGGRDSVIHVYDVSGGSLKESADVNISGHRKPVHSLALSKDETKLASGDEKDICVWDVSNGNEPIVGPGKWCFHAQRVTALSWSLDGRILASAGADDAIFLWSAESKMKRVHYKFCHRGGISGLHFLEDRKLISAGMDAAVLVWDVASDVKAKFG